MLAVNDAIAATTCSSTAGTHVDQVYRKLSLDFG